MLSAEETEAEGVRSLVLPAGFAPLSPSSNYLDLVGPLFAKQDARGLTLGIRIEPRHCNSRGLAHGGLLVTLADLALGKGAARAYQPQHGHSLAFANCYLRVDQMPIIRASAIFKVERGG